jgi:anthranilate synthase component 2
VYRNDEFNEIANLTKYCYLPVLEYLKKPDYLKDIIRKYGATKVDTWCCFGQQAIGEVYGGTLSNLG